MTFAANRSGNYGNERNGLFSAQFGLIRIILRPCQHDDGYIDDRSKVNVHTDEPTQVHSAQSSLTVTHPRTNRGRRCLTSVNVPMS